MVRRAAALPTLLVLIAAALPAAAVPVTISAAPAGLAPAAVSRAAPGGEQDAAADVVDQARRLYAQYREAAAVDPRTDLLELTFGSANAPGAVAVKGLSADHALLAGFFAELARAGIGVESSVEEVPNAEDLKRLTWALVARSSAPLADASGTGAAVRALPLGERLRVLVNRFDGRVLVQTPDGRLGWVEEKALALLNDVAFVAWNRRADVAVTAPAAPVTDADGKKLFTAPLGATLALVNSGSERFEVLLPGGGTGFIARPFAAAEKDFQSANEELRRAAPADFLARTAQSAQALVKAGAGRSDYLAPLPVAALRLHDLIAPEEPDRLARLGPPLSGGVKGRELKPGDLVFFGDAKKGAVLRAGLWLGRGRFAADDPKTGRAAVFSFDGGAKAGSNGGMGIFLWAVRPQAAELANPCLLSTRAHPFHQAPPAALKRCRLR
ncbi:hypothetical protein [uncultured Sutterella sp.]|uniref:hypothetical protein n=1 Tax=uncultured Sutterella sp. TaxID=286133 RepID=UPI0025D0285E|nr:hypothetical protein [uncultured Sutterella sp.]